MAHFALLWKARTIEKYRQNYEYEKQNSIIMSDANVPDKTLLQRWRHYSHHVQKRLSRKFSEWYPEGSTMSNFLGSFRAEMKFPHILLRSFFGFVGGLVLTYLCFVFLIFQLSLSLVNATVLSSLFGVVITLGLTFSNRIRCLVFLLIPQLFSRAGRYTLTCYALVLILTGPATNTLRNSEVLSKSMACSQEQIKTSAREINESIHKPYNTIKVAIKLMVQEMKRITVKLRSAMLRVNRLILSLASLIQINFSWLESVAKSCNDELGTPYDRCMTFLKTRVNNCCKECVDKVPWYYAAASLAKVACGVLKPFEKFCVASDFAGETFYSTVRRKLKTITTRMSDAVFLKVHTRHSYTFIGNTSSPNQVAAGIATEIRNRADPIFTWLSWSSCVTSLFLLLIIFRAKYYQHMFETRSRFDNRYITKEFRQLDLKRLREGRETVLPLSRRERAKYVTTTSFRLVASEKIFLNRSAVFMMITTFKLMIHMVADYSLYWVLMTIRHHGSKQTPGYTELLSTGTHITERGFVSRVLQSLMDSLNIPLNTPSSKTCLPNPRPPDFKGYAHIGTLISFLWFFGLFEPYGLRLRHLIMGHYKPERARTRAAWLYNHILRTRASFMKFARRKLHREYKYHSENKLTYRNWLRSLVPWQWLRCLIGVQFIKEARCLLCNIIEDSHDANTELIRCKIPNCPGTYCISCFSDIGQMCTICLSPTDYGDLSDISLERGSSDEDDNDNDVKNRDGINGCANPDENLESEDNVHTKYESDYSGNSRDIDYQMSTLLRCHKQIKYYENGYQNDAITIIDQIDKAILKSKENDKVEMPQKIYYGHAKINIDNDELKKQTFTEFLGKKRVVNIFYSYYKINIHEMSFFVTKKKHSLRLAHFQRKNTRKTKNKAPKKKYSVFITCNNDKRGGTKKVKKENKQKEKSDKNKEDPVKKVEDEKQMNGNEVPNKIIKENETKKSKHKQQKKTIKLCNNKSDIHIEYVHAKCSKYWKNISNVLSCTNINTGINTILPVIEENKHKRKKKHKNNHKKSKTHDVANTNEDARRYRISTYLADRDWKKTRMNNKAKRGSSLILYENESEINYVKIPKLNMNFSSSESHNNKEQNNVLLHKKYISQKDINYGVNRMNFKSRVFNKFIKGIDLSTIANSSSKSMIQKSETVQDKKKRNVHDRNKKDDVNLHLMEKKYHILKTLLFGTSSTNIPRGELFFRSLGNDFGRPELHDSYNSYNETINPKLNQPNTSSKTIASEQSQIVNQTAFDEGLVQRSGDKIKAQDLGPDKNNIIIPAKNNETLSDFVPDQNTIQTKETDSKMSIKEMTKKWSNIKRQSSEKCFKFKGPLFILKKICTSLFNASDSTNEGKIKVGEDTEVNKKRSNELKTESYEQNNISNEIKKESNKKESNEIQKKSYEKKKKPNEVKKEAIEIKKQTNDRNNELNEVKIVEMIETKKETADKEIAVYPCIQTCGCQKTETHHKRMDFCVQVEDKVGDNSEKYKRPATVCNVTVNAVHPTRTCATQYYVPRRDVGTLKTRVLRHQRMTTETDSELSVDSDISSDSDSASTNNLSDVTLTNTTVCSLSTVNYFNHRSKVEDIKNRKKRIRVKVVTKANQSTLTDKAKVCDVSTVTYDWWSPIVEKKQFNIKNVTLQKKEPYYYGSKDRKRRSFKNKGMVTDDRTVQFKSTAQIIPSCKKITDILSPSRYLLESQKYYNELFVSKIYSPRVYPVAYAFKHQKIELRSPVSSRVQSRRGRRAKRLDECYTRKQISPRKKRAESSRSPESSRRIWKTK